MSDKLTEAMLWEAGKIIAGNGMPLPPEEEADWDAKIAMAEVNDQARELFGNVYARKTTNGG